MRRVLDYYPKKEFRTVNNPVKMKRKKEMFVHQGTGEDSRRGQGGLSA
jgi:hypothetical protein